MSKILKIWWKIALIMIVAGIALIVLGFSLGARGGYAYIGDGRLRFSSAGTYYTIEESDLQPFDAIEVMVKASNIEIVESDHYGLEMRLPEYEDQPEWAIIDGKLTINASKTDNIFSFMSIGFHQSHYIKVYCPGGNSSSAIDFGSNKLKSVDLTAGSGGILLQGISADRIGVNTSSGNIRVESAYYQSAAAHTNSGNITFSGTGDNASLKLSATSGIIRADASGCSAVELDTKSGNITVSGQTNADAEINAKANSGLIDVDVTAWASLSTEIVSGSITATGYPHGTTSAKAGSGNVKMKLGGNEGDFSYDVSTGSGLIRIGGNRIGSPAINTKNASENSIYARTSSGNVIIDFDR